MYVVKPVVICMWDNPAYKIIILLKLIAIISYQNGCQHVIYLYF